MKIEEHTQGIMYLVRSNVNCWRASNVSGRSQKGSWLEAFSTKTSGTPGKSNYSDKCNLYNDFHKDLRCLVDQVGTFRGRSILHPFGSLKLTWLKIKYHSYFCPTNHLLTCMHRNKS